MYVAYTELNLFWYMSHEFVLFLEIFKGAFRQLSVDCLPPKCFFQTANLQFEMQFFQCIHLRPSWVKCGYLNSNLGFGICIPYDGQPLNTPEGSPLPPGSVGMVSISCLTWTDCKYKILKKYYRECILPKISVKFSTLGEPITLSLFSDVF